MIYNFNRSPPPFTGQTLVNEDLAITLAMVSTPWSRLRMSSKSKMSRLAYSLNILQAYLRSCFYLFFSAKRPCQVFTFYPDHAGFAKVHWAVIRLLSGSRGVRLTIMIHSFITYTEFVRRDFGNIRICSPKPGGGLNYIPNTLGPSREKALLQLDAHQGEPVRVGFFSGAVRAKGIDAFYELTKKHPHLQFIYGGKDWGYTGENLEYVGLIDDQNISRFFRKIDVFYFPSTYHVEFSPVVLLEAMCAGRVVVSSDFNNIDWMLPLKLQIEDVLERKVLCDGNTYREHYLNNFSRTKRDLVLKSIFPDE